MNRTDGIFAWAKTHNCEFGIEKFQLLDISRKNIPHTLNPKKRVQLPQRALMLGNHCIPSAETAKFLGVVVNNKLNWKAQGATALAKGQSWIIQFTRMTQVSCGTTARYVHKLYLTIAISHMLYAADIFLTPQKKVGKRMDEDRPNQAIVNKLVSIQRQAAIMITGTMGTTATDILDIMAGLLPFRALVDKHQHRATLWLATLPESHPLNKPISNAAKQLVKRHPMPIHDLMHTFGIQPQKIKTIKAARQSTKWKPHIKIQIVKDKNNMIKEIHKDNSDIKVFTNRSGMKGKIGAATVLYWQGRLKSQIQHKLGAQSQHMVYEGEGIATVLGAKLISNK